MKNWICMGLLCLSLGVAWAGQTPQAPTEKDYWGYLFVYFTGNRIEQEAVHYALSRDGYHYSALNQDQQILDSKTISSTGGVRDPHILRGEDGKTFYMVLTDMVSAKGWNSNRAMVMLKSTDLIHWSSHVIPIQQKYAGQENLLRVWAPQTIYDREAGKYLVYWSMKHGDGADKIYYAYANADFSDLESEPKQLFFPKDGNSCIDADIIQKDGSYYLFYKTEGHGNGIKVAHASSLTAGNWEEESDYKQQTTDAVEGSCVFKLINSDTYILMYDVYGKGRYQFTKSTDLEHFSVIDEEISMDFHPRHGTIIPITRSEWRRLVKTWGVPDDLREVTMEHNPVLDGYYADPEILYAQKTHRYYLYPTSDGFDRWSGSDFKAFSSEDLIDWKEEGVVLDLKRDVPWAGRNAWAPSIEEKKVGGKYRYFYYYSGAQKIGVASGDDPTGPFRDSGKPLIDFKPAGVSRGQEIDPDVFTDPKTGKSYLYWGNGYLAVAELNEEMLSIRKNSIRVITPDSTFREGTYVFYREGTYYFLWSENDTRSEDYRVRYGTSSSPLGPIQIPENNLVLKKDPAQGIYGTGHNSVLQVPGKDEWYIVYHRFSRPEGIQMGEAAGYHREVCMDRMQFDEDGRIIPVQPSLKGISRIPVVQLSALGKGWAKNSVNAIIFRKNSLVSDDQYQYTAYYDDQGKVVLGKRKLGSDHWQLVATPYSGHAQDAHNTISIMLDGAGYLHLSWDHHNNPLNYCKSVAPGSLEMGPRQAMTGQREQRVAYPEFYKLPNGDLLFTYRDGASGQGNLVIDRYDTQERTWTTLHDNLIDGEGKRSAYTQMTVDRQGRLHLSWVWRGSPDVATNHDMAYARSVDGGITWEKSNGTRYALPITAENAEYAVRIPENSELINQTSMATDGQGNPVIATYWKDPGATSPQFHLIYQEAGSWKVKAFDFRQQDFSLSGVGTKRIPVSRPQIVGDTEQGHSVFYLIFRDEERGGKTSVAVFSTTSGAVKLLDLYDQNLGSWEPSFDTERWKSHQILSLFIQHVEQTDLEGQTEILPQPIYVLEWNPKD